MKVLRPVLAVTLSLCMVLSIILLALLPVTSFVVTRRGVERYAPQESISLNSAEREQIVAMVWGFVVRGEPTVLPDVIERQTGQAGQAGQAAEGQQDGLQGTDEWQDSGETIAGFTADEINHLEDVRGVLRVARVALIFLLVADIALAWFYSQRFGRGPFARVCVWTTSIFGGVLALLIAWAMLQFASFFEVFHRLFFSPGTYIFPADSLLIQCFPEPFWVYMATVWIGGIAILLIALLIFGLALRRRSIHTSSTT